jgi:hypothetical protein
LAHEGLQLRAAAPNEYELVGRELFSLVEKIRKRLEALELALERLKEIKKPYDRATEFRPIDTSKSRKFLKISFLEGRIRRKIEELEWEMQIYQKRFGKWLAQETKIRIVKST